MKKTAFILIFIYLLTSDTKLFHTFNFLMLFLFVTKKGYSLCIKGM